MAESERPAAGGPSADGDQSSDPYLEVAVPTLLAGKLVPFRLYTRIQSQQVQYREEGLVLEAKHLAFLRRSSITSLWIPRENLAEYLTYIASLGEGESAPADRLRSGYRAAASATRLALHDPENESVVAVLREVIDTIDEALEQGGNSFALMQEILSKSPDLYEHSVNVAFLGLLLAHPLGLTDLPEFAMGLLFHDVGKLDLPPAILERAAPLNVEEAMLVRQHPENGIQRVKSASFVTPLIRDVILHHHERLDGSGYPSQLSGDQLSPAVRVTSIVNDFERRTTHRPYQRAQPSFEVAKQMLTENARWYDQDSLSTFVRLLGS